MPANLENSAVATGLEKVSFHSNPKKSNTKDCLNYCMIISHTGKVMLKILRARLPQYVNHELHILLKFSKSKLDLEKAKEPEIKLPTFVGS